MVAEGDCTTNANLTGHVVVVYARALYLNQTNPSVSYKLQFINSSGTVMSVPSSNTTIDVTARSGPVYRRVVAKVPNNTVPAGLNYVIFSDTNICKAFIVPSSGNPSDTGGCGYP
jgi:hypothetical protein